MATCFCCSAERPVSDVPVIEPRSVSACRTYSAFSRPDWESMRAIACL
jgi:hypothetical protein